MQGCSNVLWGLARQDAKRAQLMHGKGQMFKDMAEALLQQSRRHMCNSLPVNLSTLSWATGTLNYHPGASAWPPFAAMSFIDLQYQHYGQFSEWKLPSGLLEADMPRCRQSDGLKAWRALQVAYFHRILKVQRALQVALLHCCEAEL